MAPARVGRMWCVVAALTAGLAAAPPQPPAGPYEPTVGQPGKDVVWVPNSPEMVEKMLDMAQVTTADLVVDLGSGDGRNVIAAARRGARALGVEFNPDLVALSTRNAEAAGVADRASFVQGDMFEADFSQASVLALFLLPDNLAKLRSKFLDLKPGTRIVANTFRVPEWEPDLTTEFKDECTHWCTALLWIVPAKAGGRWQLDDQTLVLEQRFQMLTGTLTSRDGRATPIDRGRLRGAEISFVVGTTEYTGKVDGDAMHGTATSGGSRLPWKGARM